MTETKEVIMTVKRDSEKSGLWEIDWNAPERDLIRCKDCKHRDMEKGFCEGRGWPMQLVPDSGFCDKAEKKDLQGKF